MKLLIFDTETTGLPKNRDKAEKGPNNWPHIVSISWIVLDTETNKELKEKHYIVKPNGWAIPEESTKIHGITEDIALEKGFNLVDVMWDFVSEKCDVWVAHNLDFDMGVVVNAVLWDVGVQFPMVPQRKICTMNLGRQLCKLPGKYPGSYKFPKLKELYFTAFGEYPDELSLHNSLYDVKVLTEVIKHHLPLRQAMGLVVSDGNKSDGRTLTICLKHTEGDNDME